MKVAILIAALMFTNYPATAAAYTCADVRWAVKNYPRWVIRAYAKTLSKHQIEAAKKCLRGLHG